jgi:RNA polymerase sigma factor (sigma-70 family)
MPLSPHEVEVFEQSRGRLEAIAYRLLGSASDAEDAVQETFLRWQRADRAGIETPVAWLTKVLTNLCRTELTSARARRETYVGTWLPEPVLTGDRMLGPLDTVEQRDSVSTAMLSLMERLTANERAVYVLREAFGYSHGEIAELLDVTESSCQQLYRRAKQHLASDRVRAEVDTATARRIVEEFIAAAAGGQIQRLVRLLTDDVMSVGDGGGKVPARATAVVGALTVARFLRGLFKPTEVKRNLMGGAPVLYAGFANGEPAVVVVVDDRVIGVLSLELTIGGGGDDAGTVSTTTGTAIRVQAIRVQANPDKLARADRQWSASEHDEPLLDIW